MTGNTTYGKPASRFELLRVIFNTESAFVHLPWLNQSWYKLCKKHALTLSKMRVQALTLTKIRVHALTLTKMPFLSPLPRSGPSSRALAIEER